MKYLKAHFNLIRWAVHIVAWLPLVILIVDASRNNLTFNPIQAATQRTGDTAIILLSLSLACSPLSTYLKWKNAITLRRPLGLYAFMYAAIHFWLFIGADFGYQLNLIVPEFLQKYYLWVGLPAFIILLALAATSFKWAMRRLGKRWKRLHRLIYLAGLLVVLHLALVIKGDAFRLSGDVWKPLLAGLIIGILLILRVPRLRRTLLSLRHKPVAPAVKLASPPAESTLVKN
jgi:methionine sulfoxide reductase heme-binding subunit